MMRRNERIAEIVFAPICVSTARDSRAEHVLYPSPLNNKISIRRILVVP